MRATLLHAVRDIRVEDVPDPRILHPGDAVVRVIAACVCGSDLWPYRGVSPVEEPHRIGHEFVGTVEETGTDVWSVRPGDFVIAPFSISDNVCAHCRNGVQTSCVNHAWWGSSDAAGPIDGGQGQAVRVPHADGTLVPVREAFEPSLVPGLLTLSDVMSTGHHAAFSGGVTEGSTVVVVGDGAVGLCAVIAARRLGAIRIIMMSRHPDRQKLALDFGATDLVTERGEEGAARVTELLGGIGADVTLECVGTKESMEQAVDCTRPGGRVGYVGATAGGSQMPIRKLFIRNVSVAGGVAPARRYIPELLPDVLSGEITPGRVFDLELPLEEAAEAYRAMDERRAVKVLLHP
ncbi:zinc-dependent alcohol dehydrogenase family protein [Actinocorallia longicatena]|uniref:Zinc-dependent alcohol dehydrogenase family protein n=1 Tax=Actinocorallia longicatena TaxID=111803 RepID=A0ABP6QKY6_9ACTN